MDSELSWHVIFGSNTIHFPRTSLFFFGKTSNIFCVLFKNYHSSKLKNILGACRRSWGYVTFGLQLDQRLPEQVLDGYDWKVKLLGIFLADLPVSTCFPVRVWYLWLRRSLFRDLTGFGHKKERLKVCQNTVLLIVFPRSLYESFFKCFSD